MDCALASDVESGRADIVERMVEAADLAGRLPKAWIADAVDQYGEEAVAQWCRDLLAERVAFDDPRLPSLGWIGGPPALRELGKSDHVARRQDYWPRVWAARALLYVWTPAAANEVILSLRDSAWRVREMASKVVLKRELGEAAEPLEELAGDPVPRVRVAAMRALARVAEAEAAEAIRPRRDDAEETVRAAAESALAELSRRLDRPL